MPVIAYLYRPQPLYPSNNTKKLCIYVQSYRKDVIRVNLTSTTDYRSINFVIIQQILIRPKTVKPVFKIVDWVCSDDWYTGVPISRIRRGRMSVQRWSHDALVQTEVNAPLLRTLQHDTSRSKTSVSMMHNGKHCHQNATHTYFDYEGQGHGCHGV